MKTVFITGISKGIGRAIARKFLKEEYFVIGTSVTGQVDFSHEHLLVLELDLRNQLSIDSCVESVKKLSKKIDIFINNAGVLLDEGEPEVSLEKLRETLEVNLIGAIDITQKLTSCMNAGGHIINISSSAGSMTDVHHTDYPAYKISKAALNMFTAYLALKYKGKITVSSVHPGKVRTDLSGQTGDMDATEAADYIYFTATKEDLETGQFWFKGEKFPW